MYSTKVYLYNQHKRVILVDPDLELDSIYRARYHKVYAYDLKAHKGVDTTLLFQFLNQDQKPFNLTGQTFTFRVVSREGEELLLSKDLTVTNVTKGKAKIILLESDLDNIESQRAHYTIERESNSVFDPTFMDDDANARGNLDILDSVYPKFVPSVNITVPDLYVFTKPPRTAQIVTSQVETKDQLVHTFQVDITSFVGKFQIQGSVVGGSNRLEWYDITPDTGSSATTFSTIGGLTSNNYYNITGTHPFLRIKIQGTPTDIQPIEGTIDRILYR
jgi:hypothetical protein